MIKIEADMKKKKKITVKPIDTNTDEVLRVINTLRQLIMMNDDIMTNEAFMTIMKRFIDEDEKDLQNIKFEGEEKNGRKQDYNNKR